MKRTVEEKKIIAKVLSGVLDGQVGKDFFTDGGSTIWTMIQNGRITRYKQGPAKKNFLTVKKTNLLKELYMYCKNGLLKMRFFPLYKNSVF